MKRYLLSILLIAILLLPIAAAQRQATVLATNGQPTLPTSPTANPRYTIADLGTLGGVTTKGMGINEAGHIAGASQSVRISTALCGMATP